MTSYKNLNVSEELHTALKIRAAKNKNSLIEELDIILKKELKNELKEVLRREIENLNEQEKQLKEEEENEN